MTHGDNPTRSTPAFPTKFDGLLRAMDREAAEQRAAAVMQAQDEAEVQFEKEARAAFAQHCRPATLTEYTAWMIGWLSLGNEPSHVRKYPFTRVARAWMVLGERPECVPALYGSFSLRVIVPKGVDFTPQDLDDCGYSTFYFMNGFQVVGRSTPVFTDMLPIIANSL